MNGSSDLNLHQKFDENDLKGARLSSPLTKFEDLNKEWIWMNEVLTLCLTGKYQSFLYLVNETLIGKSKSQFPIE